MPSDPWWKNPSNWFRGGRKPLQSIPELNAPAQKMDFDRFDLEDAFENEGKLGEVPELDEFGLEDYNQAKLDEMGDPFAVEEPPADAFQIGDMDGNPVPEPEIPLDEEFPDFALGEEEWLETLPEVPGDLGVEIGGNLGEGVEALGLDFLADGGEIVGSAVVDVAIEAGAGITIGGAVSGVLSVLGPVGAVFGILALLPKAQHQDTFWMSENDEFDVDEMNDRLNDAAGDHTSAAYNQKYVYFRNYGFWWDGQIVRITWDEDPHDFELRKAVFRVKYTLNRGQEVQADTMDVRRIWLKDNGFPPQYVDPYWLNKAMWDFDENGPVETEVTKWHRNDLSTIDFDDPEAHKYKELYDKVEVNDFITSSSGFVYMVAKKGYAQMTIRTAWGTPVTFKQGYINEYFHKTTPAEKAAFTTDTLARWTAIGDAVEPETPPETGIKQPHPGVDPATIDRADICESYEGFYWDYHTNLPAPDGQQTNGSAKRAGALRQLALARTVPYMVR